MNKSQRKDFFREIRKSITRYLSIMLIVALGVAFFAGVRSSEPDMKISADEYYDSVNFYDIRLASTIGFTEDDIAEISATEGVKKVESIYTCEMFYKSDDIKYVLNLYSLPEGINKVTVKEGRLPQTENECLADAYFAENAGLSVGDTITFTAETGKELSDSINSDSYIITGLGTSANFLTFDRGTASIGTGKSNGYIFLNKNAFSSEVYSQAYVTVDGADKLRCYGDAYKNKIENVKNRIKETGVDRCQIRIDDYKAKANEQLELITSSYNEQKTQAETQFTQVLSQIQFGEAVITRARITIRNTKKSIEEVTATLPALHEEVQSAQKAYDEKPAEIVKWQQKLPDLKTAEQDAKTALEDAKKAYMAEPTAENVTVIEDCESDLIKASSDVIIANRNIKDGMKIVKESLDATRKKLDDANKQITLFEQQIETYTDLISKREDEAKSAREAYNEQKLESDTALADAYAKIELASKQVNAIDGAQWYTLDRETIQNYVEFISDAEKVGALGTVFPIIFFVVAALISLTTMTRMVEEQRVQIGTLKALGYSKKSIAAKYLLYALSASFIGSIIGVLIGSKLLPTVIIEAYKILYQDLLITVTPVNIVNSVIATVVAVACTTGATFLACYKELNEQAAQLMRPVAPKHGKVIMLERVPFIWKRLSFSRKSTLRNIVRYKKRFFMTLFGIAGCMGLLMVGFGLRDSIASIVDNQYQQIWIYDATATLSPNMSVVDRNILEMKILSNENVDEGLMAQVKAVDVTNGETEKSVHIFVPETTNNLDDFVILKNRKTDERYSLTNDGVIISEKLSKQMKAGVGDKISIKEDNVVIGEVKVSAVVENYIYNYMYMTPSQYQELYDKAPEFNDMYLTLFNSDEASRNKLATEFTGNEKITAVSFVNELQQKVENMMRSLDYVVWVLIASAGLLALVVLYNLVNINITERKRELATIKLLGFYDLELAQYVYRENIILTILGTALGVVFGIFLHQFVIQTTEIDMIMFGRQISLQSYFFSIVLTLFFAFIINFWMYFRLKKIDMVESLKSVE